MRRKIGRRDFVKFSAAGAASVVLAGCQSDQRWVTLEPYVRPPEEQLAGIATWFASTCRQCPAGCGIIVRVMNGRAVKIEGNPEHPLNQGKLCARGQAGLQVLYNPDRLPGPVMQAERGSRKYEALVWNEAFNRLYAALREAGEGTAIWCGSRTSGHLVALFKRFNESIGAPDPVQFDMNSGLNGYAPLRQASERLWGAQGLPNYELGRADIVFSFGANFLGSWLSAVRYGVEYGRFRDQPLGKRGYLVQFEPRMSITGAKADQWIPLRPGSEGLVARAIAFIIADQALGQSGHADRARTLAGQVDVGSVADFSGISIENLTSLAHLFASSGQALAVPGPALTGQEHATDALDAVQALNIISNAETFSLSPDATFNELYQPSSASFQDVEAMINRMRAGDVRALLIHNANPAYELPPKFGFLEALEQVPLVVSFASFVDETAALADLILPDRTPLESWGYEVVSPRFSRPVVSSQQPVVEAEFDVRATGDILLTVARGIPQAADALPWKDEVAFLKESIARLPPGTMDGASEEVRWARFLQHGGWWTSTSSSAHPLLVVFNSLSPIEIPQHQGEEDKYPYHLHLYLSDLLSDGQGASQPWLQGSPDPMTTISWQSWVELYPDTAAKLDVGDGDLVRVTSPHGSVEIPVCVYPGIRPDTIAIPLGQGHTACGRYARDRGANPIILIGGADGGSENNLPWADLRVQVKPTGKKIRLARFENVEGVATGFINQAFPGE